MNSTKDYLSSINPELKKTTGTITFSAFTGGVIAGLTQPAYVIKTLAQQANAGTTTYKSICSRIIETEGIRGFWKALSVSIPKSSLKQGTKSSTYAFMDNTDLSPYAKAMVAAITITMVLTPLDRLANAFIGNKNISKKTILVDIFNGGPGSIYRGAKVDLGKNIIESGCVFGTRRFDEAYKNLVGHKLNLAEWLGMTFFATATKLLITNPWDTCKSEIQKHLKTGGKSLTMRKVIEIKGLRHVMLAGIVPRFAMNYLGMMGNFATLELNDWMHNKGRFTQE